MAELAHSEELSVIQMERDCSELCGPLCYVHELHFKQNLSMVGPPGSGRSRDPKMFPSSSWSEISVLDLDFSFQAHLGAPPTELRSGRKTFDQTYVLSSWMY